jgi:BirA family biotin operon repressor/biotin-[acetyl-CoA-carboxylase] ligase
VNVEGAGDRHVAPRQRRTELPADLAEALDAARARLGPFADLRAFGDVASTNDIALELASAGASEGVSVLADSQRAGRGRRGHTWFSPPGAGLYLSILIRPGSRDSLSLLTLTAGVGAARAIAGITRLPIELKWPNDLVIGRPWRKLGGLLCEASGSGGVVESVVIGIGINCRPAAYPPELGDRATSIEAELGRPWPRPALVIELLASVRDSLRQLRSGSGWVVEEWRRFARPGLGGAPVRWRDSGVERRGAARDIDADGALIVEPDDAASPVRLVAGEVFWERLSRE